jgi:hypothetical protein
MARAPVDDGSGDIYVVEFQCGSECDLSLPPGRTIIWKLNPDGSVDGSFTQGEVHFTGDTGPNSFEPTQINSIVPIGDGSGRAYVCGRFDRYMGWR